MITQCSKLCKDNGLLIMADLVTQQIAHKDCLPLNTT
jgi:hypothetical protein